MGCCRSTCNSIHILCFLCTFSNACCLPGMEVAHWLSTDQRPNDSEGSLGVGLYFCGVFFYHLGLPGCRSVHLDSRSALGDPQPSNNSVSRLLPKWRKFVLHPRRPPSYSARRRRDIRSGRPWSSGRCRTTTRSGRPDSCDLLRWLTVAHDLEGRIVCRVPTYGLACDIWQTRFRGPSRPTDVELPQGNHGVRTEEFTSASTMTTPA